MRAQLIASLISILAAGVAYGGAENAGKFSQAPKSRLTLQAPFPESLTPEQLLALPPQQQIDWVERRVAKQRGGFKAAAMDITGPTLTKFEARTTLVAGNPMPVKVTLTDDLSGAKGFVAFARRSSMDPYYMTLSHKLSAPEVSWAGSMVVDVLRDVPAGNYKFDYAYAYDEAGNYSRYYGDQLASLGRSSFDVTNAKRGDTKRPRLVTGGVLNGYILYSDTVPGTNIPAYATMSFTVEDTGDLSISGVKSVEAEFCIVALTQVGPCFYGMTGEALAPGQAKATVIAGLQPKLAGVSPGNYTACTVRITDWVGNSEGYQSIECGGSTDFRTLFPTGYSISVWLSKVSP